MMSISLEFTDFTVRDDIISYKNMFASADPQLRGKPLCEELQEMDRREYQVIQIEEAQIITLSKPSLFLPVLNLAMSVAGIVIGVFLYKSPISTMISFVCLCYSIYQLTTKSPDAKKVGELCDSRLSRLQTKIRVLDEKIPQTQDPDKKEQLKLAKDYFFSKYDIYRTARSQELKFLRV
jgi:hypothetical protein